MATKKRTAKKLPPRDLTGKSIAFFGAFSFWPSYHPGEPPELAQRLGATVHDKVDETLDYLVLGDKRGAGRADAKKKAEKLRARAEKAKKTGEALPCPEVLDEATFREMVRIDLTGKSFAFYGGFTCCGGDIDEGLLTSWVNAVGGVVTKDVDEKLDYLVLGNHRGPSKIATMHKAEKLQAAGAKVQTLSEDAFRELVHTDKPATTSKGGMDFATFYSHLHGTVDQGKLGRAMKMLKSESFKLYVHLGADRLVGVVRSQTGSGTVYASWLTPEGHYGCSTPELEDCMGLQGSPCKHLLVLLVGLARTAGGMEPQQAFTWISATRSKRPRRDSELAAQTFLEYRGAQAGEIDWRPTETIPEDFYAF
jgi:BRCT domain type II-containing protein